MEGVFTEAAMRGLKLLNPSLQRIVAAMTTVTEEEALSLGSGRSIHVRGLRKKKVCYKEDVDRVRKALAMHNSVYTNMWRAGKKAFCARREACKALHRPEEKGATDIVRLAAAHKTAEEELKYITSWCVSSRIDAKLLEEKYANNMARLKDLEADIFRSSLPPAVEARGDSRVADLKATIQLLSTWM
jgi:hypothetical protein